MARVPSAQQIERGLGVLVVVELERRERRRELAPLDVQVRRHGVLSGGRQVVLVEIGDLGQLGDARAGGVEAPLIDLLHAIEIGVGARLPEAPLAQAAIDGLGLDRVLIGPVAREQMVQEA